MTALSVRPVCHQRGFCFPVLFWSGAACIIYFRSFLLRFSYFSLFCSFLPSRGAPRRKPRIAAASRRADSAEPSSFPSLPLRNGTPAGPARARLAMLLRFRSSGDGDGSWREFCGFVAERGVAESSSWLCLDGTDDVGQPTHTPARAAARAHRGAPPRSAPAPGAKLHHRRPRVLVSPLRYPPGACTPKAQSQR